MPLITLVLGLAIVGLLVWMIETYIPMAEPFKIAIRVIVLIVVIFYLLQVFGFVGPTVPRIR